MMVNLFSPKCMMRSIGHAARKILYICQKHRKLNSSNKCPRTQHCKVLSFFPIQKDESCDISKQSTRIFSRLSKTLCSETNVWLKSETTMEALLSNILNPAYCFLKHRRQGLQKFSEAPKEKELSRFQPQAGLGSRTCCYLHLRQSSPMIL